MAYVWQHATPKIEKALQGDYQKALQRTLEFDPTPVGKRVFYVAADAAPGGDGRTPATAFGTPAALEGQLQAGDTVLFACGSEFRCCIPMVNGVTYSAYGEGPKPHFYGSVDASNESDWIAAGRDVYRYAKNVPYRQDVGNIVFDGGKAWGVKLQKLLDADAVKDLYDVDNGLEVYPEIPSYPLAGGKDLSPAFDLTFYHDFDGILYLVSRGGNPAGRFSSIELGGSVKICEKSQLEDITITNLHFSNTGCFAICCDNCVNLTVRNCQFEFIGGSFQFGYDDPGRNFLTRYGNAIENWGDCDGMTVEYCSFKQIYDAAITTQHNREGNMKNLTYRHNVFDCFEYAYELFNGEGHSFVNLVIENCACKNIGGGLPTQRFDRGPESFIKCNRVRECQNCVVRGNLILGGVDSMYLQNNIQSHGTEKGFFFTGNTYLQSREKAFGNLPVTFPVSHPDLKKYPYAEGTVKMLTDAGMDADSVFYYLLNPTIRFLQRQKEV